MRVVKRIKESNPAIRNPPARMDRFQVWENRILPDGEENPAAEFGTAGKTSENPPAKEGAKG
jgi:hypothetical protein